MNNTSLIKNCRWKNLIILSIILFSNQVLSQNHIDNPNYLKIPSNILRFADYLFCEKDYLRAIDEYDSYLSKIENDTVQFKIGLAYSRMADYQKSNEIFTGIKWNGKLNQSAKEEIFKNYFLIKKPDSLDSLNHIYYSMMDEVSNQSVSRLYHFSWLYDESLTKISNEKPAASKEKYLAVFSVNMKEEINQFYIEKKSLPYRSPTFASILSAIIPGAGKIYSSQYTDGFTSLLVTGLLSYLSYDNFNAGHKFRGWLFGGLAAYFYAGNIYGSAAAAQIYNAEVNFNFHVKLDSFIKKQNYFIPKYDFLCE